MTAKKAAPSFLPIALFLFSLLLNFFFLSKGPYHLDCLNLIIQAENTLKTGQVHYLFGPGYPLTVILAAGSLLIGKAFGVGDPATSVNAMSALIGAGTIWVHFLWMRRWTSESGAFWSALLLLGCPIFLGLAVYGNSHIPTLFFLVLGLLFWDGYSERQKTLYFWLSAVSLGFMGANRIQDLILMVVPLTIWGLSFVQFKFQAKIIGRLFLFWGIVLSVVLLFHLPFLLSSDQSGYPGQLSSFWRLGVSENFLGFISQKWLAVAETFLIVLSPLGVLLSVLGFAVLWRRQRQLFWFLFFWLVFPLLFYGNIRTLAPRYLLLAILPTISAAGYFLSVCNGGRSWKTLFAYLCGLGCFFIQISPVSVSLSLRREYALLPEFCRFSAAFIPPEGRIIVADEGLFMLRYAQRRILDRPRRVGLLSGEELQNFASSLDTLLAQNIPVYISSAALYAYDWNAQFSSFIKNRYQLHRMGSHLYEDWHSGELQSSVFVCHLYRLEKGLPQERSFSTESGN